MTISVLYSLATSLAVGCATPLLLVPVKGLGRKFFIFMSLLALGFYAVAIAREGLALGYLHASCAGLLILYNVILPKEGSWWALLVLAGAVVLGNFGLAEDGRRAAAEIGSAIPAAAILVPAAAVVSSALLGASLSAMTLGHFYLVAPGLSFGILIRAIAGMLALLVLRFAVLAAALIAQRGPLAGEWERLGPSGFLLSHGFFLGIHLLFGLLAPAALGWMALLCARERSNQSATGILYVVMAFVLTGEIIAKQLLASGEPILV